MRVAVFATNPRGIYSGGRYASLIMAYALARAGVETTYVTDNVPMFDSDFAVYDSLVFPLRKVIHPRLEYTGEAAEWAIIIPSGGVTDLVYDAAEQYATRAGSRVALFSFETPNWFNSLSAYPKVALAWEAWRRCMARGGLVLTIAQEGIKPAREFYYSPHRRAALEFAFWHPPINDLVADAVQPSDYRSKVVAFVRTQDAHKGAADILRLDPSILSGYTLALVFGYSADSKYLEAIRAHFSGAAVKIEVYERITDLQKFELLSHACLLLFPSYFEGYGYPLVEAAYMGVPSVAYDLPVIRETVGDAAIYAAIGDYQAFSRAIESALLRQPGPVIRDQLKINPGTLTAGLRLARILQRQLRRVSPISRAPLPRTLSVPIRTAVLADPLVRADWDAIGHPPRLKDLRAVLAPGLLTVAGTVLTEDNATISVRMAGVEPITQVISGTRANTTHEFTLQLSTGPLANLDQVCTVILAENNKTVTSIPISPSITPDLLFRADAWAGCADMRPVSRDAGHVVIVASLDRLLILEDDTVAIAELSAVFSRMGYVVELIVRTDNPSPRSFPMLDVDMLPLADTVVIVPQNYRPTGYSWSNPFVKAAAIIVLAENGDNETFATPTILIKFKSLENVCLTVSAIESSETVESTNIEYLPTIPLVSRSEARRANRRLLILLREAARIDDGTLTRLIRDVFPTVAARFGLIRVLIDHGIAARPAFSEEQLPVGWTVQSANFGTMIATMREAGTTVIINHASKPSSRKLLAIGSEFDAKIIEASDSTSSLTIADMLVELFAGNRDLIGDSVIAKAIATYWPSRRSAGSPPLPALRHVTTTRLQRWGNTSPLPRPMTLNKTLSFTTSSSEDVTSYLIAGWTERDVNGAKISDRGAIIAFTTLEPAGEPATLFILLRSTAPNVPAACTIYLNDYKLGEATLEQSGSKGFNFTVPARIWRPAALQTLRFAPGNTAVVKTEHLPFVVAISFATPSLPNEWRVDARTIPATKPHQIVDLPLPAQWEFDEGGNGQRVLGAGWDKPEKLFTWSNANTAALVFDGAISADGPIYIVLKGGGLVAATQYGQRVRVELGGNMIAEVVIEGGSIDDYAFVIPSNFSQSGFNSLLLNLPNAITPFELGLNKDLRKLALRLHRLAIHRCEPPIRGNHQKELRGWVEFTGIPFAAGVVRLSGNRYAAGAIVQDTQSGSIVTPIRPLGKDRWEAWCAISNLVSPNYDLSIALSPYATSPPSTQQLAVDDVEFFGVGETSGSETNITVNYDVVRAPASSTWSNNKWSFGRTTWWSGTSRPFDEARPLLTAGWSRAEATHTCSVGYRALIDLSALTLPPRMIVLNLVLRPVLNGETSLQRVEFKCGFTKLAAVELREDRLTSVSVAVDRSQDRQLDELELTLPLAENASQEGLSADTSTCGVQLCSMSWDEAVPQLNNGALATPRCHLIPRQLNTNQWSVRGLAELPGATLIHLAGPREERFSYFTIQGSNLFALPYEDNEGISLLLVASAADSAADREIVVRRATLGRDIFQEEDVLGRLVFSVPTV